LLTYISNVADLRQQNENNIPDTNKQHSLHQQTAFPSSTNNVAVTTFFRLSTFFNGYLSAMSIIFTTFAIRMKISQKHLL